MATEDYYESHCVRYENSKVSKLPTQSIVYFLRAIGYGVKIGFTTNLKQRLDDYKTYVPVEMVLIGSLRGTRRYEKLLHTKFSEHRIRGEWFHERIIPDLLEIIDSEQIAA